MKQSLSRLFEFKSLKDRYLSLAILAALLILSFGASAQYDSTKPRQAQNGYGFDWKNGKFQTLITGIDTPKMAFKDSGAIAYKGGKIWIYTGRYWKEPTASAIPTAYDSVTRKISGDVVWSGAGLVFNSNTITYKILGQTYTAAPANLTLAVADTSLNRKDIIYVDNTGNIGILTGTPGSGSYPVPNPASQLQLIQIDVPADATVPGNISDVVVYAENIEWVGTTAISGGLFNYTGNPHAGTVSSYIPTFTNGQSIYYEAVPSYTAANYQYLKFWVRLNTGGTSSPTRFNITFGNGVIPASTSVVVMNGVYGLNGFTVNAWQEVVIPISAFVFSSPTFNRLTFRLTLASGDGFQLDDIKLQSGGGTTTGNGVITFNGRDGNVLPIRSDYPTDSALISRIASDSIAANSFAIDTVTLGLRGDTLYAKGGGATDTALIKRVVSDTANQLLRLSGTEVNKPVTGDIELDDVVGPRRIYSPDKFIQFGDDGILGISSSDGVGTSGVLEVGKGSLSLNTQESGLSKSLSTGSISSDWVLSSTWPLSKGLVGDRYYGNNADSLTYIQRKMLDDSTAMLKAYADSVAAAGGGSSVGDSLVRAFDSIAKKQDTGRAILKGGQILNAGDFIGSTNNSSLRFRTNNTLTAQLDSFTSYGGRLRMFGDAGSYSSLDAGFTDADPTLTLAQFGGATTIKSTGLMNLRANSNWEVRSNISSGNILEVKNNLSGTLSPSYFNVGFTGAVGIGNPTPASSAALDITSTDKGLLIPRMTNTQINAISSPATGLMVYNTTDSVGMCYDGLQWRDNGSVIVNNNLATTQNTFADFRLVNNTAATVGAQKISPALGLYGNGWSTTSGASRRVGFVFDVLPIQGTTAPTAELYIRADINGTKSIPMTLTSGGVLALGSNLFLNATSRVQFGGTGAANPAFIRNGTNVIVALADATSGAGLGVGMASATGVSASAILEATSTTKGFLPPRMTNTQMEAISSPAQGLQVFNTTDSSIATYTGRYWGRELIAYKTATQSVTSSTTYIDDNQLQLTISSGTWVIRWGLTGATTPGGFRYRFDGPTHAAGSSAMVGTVNYTGVGIDLNGTTQTGAMNSSNSTATATSGQLIWRTTSSGILKMQWAQSVSNTTATTLGIGCYMTATRIN